MFALQRCIFKANIQNLGKRFALFLQFAHTLKRKDLPSYQKGCFTKKNRHTEVLDFLSFSRCSSHLARARGTSPSTYGEGAR